MTMRNHTALALVVAFASSPLACTSAGGDRPPASSDQEPFDAGSLANADASLREASVNDAGTKTPSADASEEEASAAAPDGAPVQVQPGSDASMAEPACSLSATWSAPVSVPGLATFATVPFVTMTSDELTVAWVVDNGLGGSVFVADRTSSTDPFGPASALTFPVAQSTGARTRQQRRRAAPSLSRTWRSIVSG